MQLKSICSGMVSLVFAASLTSCDGSAPPPSSGQAPESPAPVVADRASQASAAAAEEVDELADATEEDLEGLRQVAVAIFGEEKARGWTINAQSAGVLSDATKQILECSTPMGMVPKPVGFMPGWGYIAKNALQLATFVTGNMEDKRFELCRLEVVRNYQTAMGMASMEMHE